MVNLTEQKLGDASSDGRTYLKQASSLLDNANSELKQIDGFSFTQLLDDALKFLDEGRAITATLCMALQAEAMSKKTETAGKVEPAFLLVGRQLLENIISCPHEQLILVAPEVAIVARMLVELGATGRHNEALDGPMVDLLLRLVVTTVQGEPLLTPLHTVYLQACAASMRYSAAYQNLKKWDMLEVRPKEYGLTPKDYLLYFYYAGCVCIAMEDFEEAHAMLAQCYLMPAMATSNIAVQAIKKDFLLQLLLDSKAPELPSYAPAPLKQYCSNVLAHEVGYKEVFAAPGAGEAVTRVLEDMVSVGNFTADENLGLVQRLPAAYTRHQIRNLTSTYVTLSLAEIAKQANLESPEEAERLLMTMVVAGEVDAKIDRSTMSVRFGSKDAANGDGCESVAEDTALLEARLQASFALQTRIRDVQKKILTSDEYLRGGAQ